MNFKNVTISALTVLCLASHLVYAHSDRAFYHAVQYGATARFIIEVVDDLERPVGGVKITARFDSALKASGELKSFVTDTNGMAVVSGKTGKSVSLRATKDGYYGSTDEVCFVSMGQGVKNGTWQPNDFKKIIVLNQMKNPMATRPNVSYGRYTNITGKWLGFDIAQYDFVKPNGKGEVADFEVKFEWDGQRGENFHGMDMDMRFPESFAGAYYHERVMQSEFKDAYFASTNATYQKTFTFYSRPIRNLAGEIVARNQRHFDATKTLIVRSRCVLNDDGTLKSARYSEITDLSFGCGRKGAWIMFQPIFNPTPNDTNLEPK